MREESEPQSINFKRECLYTAEAVKEVSVSNVFSTNVSLTLSNAGSEAGQSLGVLHQHSAGRSAAAQPPSPLQQHPLSSHLQQRECAARGASQLWHRAGTSMLLSDSSLRVSII